MEKFEKFKQHFDFFSGWLSGDAEIKYFENGKCKTTFSIPLKKNKEDEAIWLNCEAWGKIAEKCSELKKGDEVTVIGNLKESNYQDKEGNNKTKIIFSVKGIL